jgi:gliding motility-associated-like protein
MVTSSPLATFNYSSLTFCKGGTNPLPSFIAGASAGTFTSTTGLVINSSTGEINLSASDAGLYTVTNTILAANGCSSDTKTTQVEILVSPVIVQPLPVSVCNSYLLPALTIGNYFSQPGGVGTPLDITVPITVSQTVYIYVQNSICSNEKSFIVTINTAPIPTLNITQPTCNVQTGTIEVTTPISTGGGIVPSNLFISEVTDESTGSLTYVEIFNGTGASVDLSNYKLKFYNNGGTTTSCNNQLTGILNNNSTFVVAVGSSPSSVVTGVRADLTFTSCGGVNTNDNIRLTTNSGTEIDLWGDTSGSNFTPSNQAGYTYRRNTTAVVPSLTWNPADWNTLDPQDYSNIGSYNFSSSNYEYSLDGGAYQLPVTFNLVAVGAHTVTVHDLLTGCYSVPFSVTLNAVPSIPSVTSFSYPTTPICKNATTNPIPSPDLGFTLGGTYSCATLGTSLNSTTGIIDLSVATSGTHIVRYTVNANPITCTQAGSATFTIVINPIITPVTTISYASSVCKNATINPTPNTSVTGFTTGGVYSCATLGTSLNSTSGVIDLTNINAVAGSHTITYTVNANPATCQVANSSNATIIINSIVTPVTTFDYATPICAVGSMAMPRPGIGFTNGGTYSSTSGLSISSSTGEIISTNSTPGNYMITYSVAANTSTCQVSGIGTTNIVISNPVGVTISGECLGSNYSLKANAIGSSFDPTNVVYSWADGSGLTIGNTQSIIVTNPDSYTVSVISNGCTGTANINVSNTTCSIQKGISPNGDGDNENFVLSDVNELNIFNRYGTKVYSHGANYTNEWHGQSNGGSELPDGTYYYVIKRSSGEAITGWIYINR